MGVPNPSSFRPGQIGREVIGGPVGSVASLFQPPAPNYGFPRPIGDEEQEITLLPHELLAVELHIEDAAVPDLWDRLAANEGALMAELSNDLGRAAAEELGSDFVVTIAMRPGSVRATVMAWVRNSWSRTGEAVRKSAHSVRVGFSRLRQRLADTARATLQRFSRRWGKIAPTIRSIGKKIGPAVSLLSSVASILTYLGVPGGELIDAARGMLEGGGYVIS